MSIWELIAALTWRDALDFALLFLLLYGVLGILRGTRATPVLVAVALVAAVAFIAKVLELVAVATVLRYFLEYAILILIVVFHQEIRRLLLRIGQRFVPHARTAAELPMLGELATGLERLQRAKIGALVVLEREILTAAVCSDPGRPIDAQVRADTIFALAIPHPGNPAHDGAIVIRNGRIVRAGVICPLADTVPDSRFGTRHRGALGVSEETDAVVIVLSEERGEIRIVQSGIFSEPIRALNLPSVINERLSEVTKPSASTASASASQSSMSASMSLMLDTQGAMNTSAERELLRSTAESVSQGASS